MTNLISIFALYVGATIGVLILLDTVVSLSHDEWPHYIDAAFRKKEYDIGVEDIVYYYTEHTDISNKIFTSTRHSKQTKEFPTITFSQFKDFYYLNPESWTLNGFRVYKNNKQELSFTFEYKEWKKYNRWKKQIDKRKEEERHNQEMREASKFKDETTLKILKLIQDDIDNIRAESEKNFKDAAELIKEVSNKC